VARGTNIKIFKKKKSSQMWPAGTKGPKIEFMFDKVDQNVTSKAGARVAKI
jgi:hypothetical protein